MDFQTLGAFTPPQPSPQGGGLNQAAPSTVNTYIETRIFDPDIYMIETLSKQRAQTCSLPLVGRVGDGFFYFKTFPIKEMRPWQA